MPSKKAAMSVSASHKAHASPNGDKRRHSRKRTLKTGKVILSDSASIDCVIREVSPTGARLVFGGPTVLPKLFRLLFVETGSVRPAILVWQKGLAAGVCFELPEQLAPR